MGCQAFLTLPVGVLRYILPARSSICGWPELASILGLEEGDDLLKLLFAHVIAHFIHFLGIKVSVSLEFSQHGVELPSTLKVLPENLHFGIQVLEFEWISVSLYRRINTLPQIIPGLRLTHAGSRLTHAGSRLTCTGSRLSRVGSRLRLEDVDDHLKRLFAL